MQLKYSIHICFSEEDDCYLVSLPELTTQKYVTHGKTYEEALAMGLEVMEALVEIALERGEELPDIPKPD